MIQLKERLEKNKFIEKMSDKAYDIYKDSYQRQLRIDAYLKGVEDAIKELKKDKI